MRQLLTLLLFCCFSAATLAQKEVDTREYINSIYIPKDLADCFAQINSWWNDSVKTEVKNKMEDAFTANAHMAVGLWMRNNWGLWKGSRLRDYFRRMGVFHPDDISGIILTSYHRHLRNEPLRLEEQVKSCEQYWKAMAIPKKNQYPKGTPSLEFNTSYYYDRKEGQGILHVGTSKSSNCCKKLNLESEKIF